MLSLIREKRFDEAISLGKKRILENTLDFDAYYLLGMAYLSTGNIEQSIEHLQTVLINRPNDYKCSANLGVAYRRIDNFEQSMHYLKKALAINPSYLDARYNLASVLFSDKQLDQALEIFLKLVEQYPNNCQYRSSLADTYRQLGQWNKAIQEYLGTLEIDDCYYHSHLNLGILYLYFGETDKSLLHSEKSVKLKPTEYKANQALGDCYVQLEQLNEAMDCYANAYDLKNDSADLCVSIGKVWQDTGDKMEAASWFDKAIVLENDCLDAKCYLAKIISDNNHSEEAIEILEPLLQANQDHIQLNLTLSDIYWDDGNADLAMQRLERVKALQPNHLTVLIKMASILNSSGDTDGAIKLYQETLRQNPYFVPGLNGLAVSQKGELSRQQVSRMEQLLAENINIKAGRLSAIHAGLAHYYDANSRDNGTIEKAAFHLSQANKKQWDYRSQRDWNYSRKNYETNIDLLMATFDKSYFENIKQRFSKRLLKLANSKITPVFIVAMPRSGTTLTEQILARHSKVLGVGERPYASQSFQAFNNSAEFNDARGYLSKLSVENIELIASQYLEKLERLIDKSGKKGVTHVVDKMPDNYSLLGWLLTLFPQAKIIHAGRDPRDVALSCWMTQFASIPWACKTDDLVHRIKQYQKIMEHWQGIIGNRVFESQYEDLVANQELCSKQLVAFLGLDWEERCLSFHKSDRLVRTASITQVRQPIYTKSVRKWRRYADYIPELSLL